MDVAPSRRKRKVNLGLDWFNVRRFSDTWKRRSWDSPYPLHDIRTRMVQFHIPLAPSASSFSTAAPAQRLVQQYTEPNGPSTTRTTATASSRAIRPIPPREMPRTSQSRAAHCCAAGGRGVARETTGRQLEVMR